MKLKQKKCFEYDTACTMNLEYMKVSIFELYYRRKRTLSQYAIFLRRTCIYVCVTKLAIGGYESSEYLQFDTLVQFDPPVLEIWMILWCIVSWENCIQNLAMLASSYNYSRMFLFMHLFYICMSMSALQCFVIHPLV